MKGNKRILTLSILGLLLAVTFTTYAMYRSSAEGEGTFDAANERFYYLTDTSDGKAVFIFSNNIHQGQSSATPENNEITGEENVMDWFLLEGNTTNECNDISALINQFRAKMIDYNS